MGNALGELGRRTCYCCCSCCGDRAHGATDAGKPSTTRLLQDEEDTWFRQEGKAPLLPPHHDHADDGVVKKVVVMRSPRTASVRPESVSSAHPQQLQPRSGSATAVASSPPSPRRHGGGHAPREPHSATERAQDAKLPAPLDDMAKAPASRSGSESDSPVKVPRPSELSPRRRRVTFEDGDDDSGPGSSERSFSFVSHDDDGASGASPRSPRSPSRQPSSSSSSSSSTTPAASADSPRKKGRYGRKNYRANSNRKKHA